MKYINDIDKQICKSDEGNMAKGQLMKISKQAGELADREEVTDYAYGVQRYRP